MKEKVIKIMLGWIEHNEPIEITADKILDLFDVVRQSEQLPPTPITDKEHKDLMKLLYPKDYSKRFSR